ncbi:hypothetical protein ACQP1O_08935 [Nocardia sp. CA-151230]
MTTTETDNAPAIRVRGLEKSYGQLEVLSGVDFDAPSSAKMLPRSTSK